MSRFGRGHHKWRGGCLIRARLAGWLLVCCVSLSCSVAASAGDASTPIARSSLLNRSVCASAIEEAEQQHGLPQGLLQAISVVESRRHPHALNLGPEQGSLYPDRREDAHGLILDALSRGERPMVGCLQVNVAIHAPQDPGWALNPRRAANWAAFYLATHARAAGSLDAAWPAAVMRFNGARGAAANRYVCRVAGALNGLGHIRTEWLILSNLSLDSDQARRRCETSWRQGFATAEALKTPLERQASLPVITMHFISLAIPAEEEPPLPSEMPQD